MSLISNNVENPDGRCSLYGKAEEYVIAIMQGVSDERRVYLHKKLAELYDLKPSETRHITDNLPIPTDPYAERASATIAKCAGIITNEFSVLQRRKNGEMSGFERKS